VRMASHARSHKVTTFIPMTQHRLVPPAQARGLRLEAPARRFIVEPTAPPIEMYRRGAL